jgi:p-aminobenzoyl-glutamate transporter AbgT
MNFLANPIYRRKRQSEKERKEEWEEDRRKCNTIYAHIYDHGTKIPHSCGIIYIYIYVCVCVCALIFLKYGCASRLLKNLRKLRLNNDKREQHFMWLLKASF